MKSQLTVDDALDQTVAAMNEGARPWTLGPAAAQRIRDAYRPDFEIQFRRPLAWERESGKVLRLARWAGAVAALLAETEVGSGHRARRGAAGSRVRGNPGGAPRVPHPGLAARRRGRRGALVQRAVTEVPNELLRKAATLFTAD